MATRFSQPFAVRPAVNLVGGINGGKTSSSSQARANPIDPADTASATWVCRLRPPTRAEMKANLVPVCLVIAGCASPSMAGAQTPAPADQFERHAAVVGAKAYSCVDPSDVLARRWFQDEPCRWPLYHLPAAVVPGSNESLPLPKYPQPPAGVQAGHAMFWRFPVQPMGPYEAPRHSFH